MTPLLENLGGLSKRLPFPTIRTIKKKIKLVLIGSRYINILQTHVEYGWDPTPPGDLPPNGDTWQSGSHTCIDGGQFVMANCLGRHLRRINMDEQF